MLQDKSSVKITLYLGTAEAHTNQFHAQFLPENLPPHIPKREKSCNVKWVFNFLYTFTATSRPLHLPLNTAPQEPWPIFEPTY